MVLRITTYNFFLSFFLSFFLFLMSYTHAQALTAGGHAKYTFGHKQYPDNALAVSNGGRHQTEHTGNIRLAFAGRQKGVGFKAHYEMLSLLAESDNITAGYDPDRYRLFDLTHTLEETNDFLFLHRLDRLFVAHSAGNLVVRLGRQAVSWGNGLVYHPMDIFNPFGPAAIDTDYKPGDDMLYAQWVTASGNDLQCIVLPRRNNSHDLREEESSFSVKYHGLYAFGDVDLLAARHFGQELLGAGFSRPVGESLWRIDATITRLAGDRYKAVLTTNMDYSWEWFDHNIYGFAEYYHNGFGEERYTASPDSELAERLARAELFTQMKNYCGMGLQIELHPLVRFAPTITVNLDDMSGLAPITLSWDMKQDLVMKLSGIFSWGDNESEYGGPATPGQTVQMQVSYYF